MEKNITSIESIGVPLPSYLHSSYILDFGHLCHLGHSLIGVYGFDCGYRLKPVRNTNLLKNYHKV